MFSSCNIKTVIRTCKSGSSPARRPEAAQERKHRKQIHKAVLPRLFDKRGNIAQTKVACFQKGSGGGEGGDLASKHSRGALTQTCERGVGSG